MREEDAFVYRRDESYARMVEKLTEAMGLVESLPSTERHVCELAIGGLDVHQIAQRTHMSEDAVWHVLQAAVDLAEGRPGGGAAHGYESGGLGADTDPGVTGGYGDTGFGSLGLEPPIAIPEEPLTPGEIEEDEQQPPGT